MSVNELEVCTPLSPLGHTETRKSAVCALVEWCIPRFTQTRKSVSIEPHGRREGGQVGTGSPSNSYIEAIWPFYTLVLCCGCYGCYVQYIYMLVLYTWYIQPDEMLCSCNVHIYICEHSMCVRSMYVHGWMDGCSVLLHGLLCIAMQTWLRCVASPGIRDFRPRHSMMAFHHHANTFSSDPFV